MKKTLDIHHTQKLIEINKVKEELAALQLRRDRLVEKIQAFTDRVEREKEKEREKEVRALLQT